MMAVVLVIACGFAALRNPSLLMASTVYTATTAILLVAILCAVYHEGPKRYFWMGFAIFGWGHQLLSVWPLNSAPRVPLLLTTYLFMISDNFLADGYAGFLRSFIASASIPMNQEELYLDIGTIALSLFSLLIAYIAALVTQSLFVRRDRSRVASRGHASREG
jgi:hypothetical protein